MTQFTSQSQRSGGERSQSAAPASPRNGAVSGHPILRLHSAIGNRAVQRLIEESLAAPADDDLAFEQTASSMVLEVLNTPGEPLDAGVRELMEETFDADFSGVRVHTDASAAHSAKAIRAHAYTSGSDLVFADGRYAPTTSEGQKLLAHELTHVVQQSAGPVAGTPTADGALSISDPLDSFEQEAEGLARRVIDSGATNETPSESGRAAIGGK